MQISADRIRAIEARRDEVQANMARSDLAAEEFVRLSKEYAELEPVAKAAHEVRRLRQELKALEHMTGPDAEPDMREKAEDERSEEHTSELQYLMRNSYAVFRLKQK